MSKMRSRSGFGPWKISDSELELEFEFSSRAENIGIEMFF